MFNRVGYSKPMRPYKFPEQNTIIAATSASPESLVRALETVFAAAAPFTGYLKVATNKNLFYFLFFLQGEAYAAGKFSDNKSFNLTISAFFEEVARLAAAELSLHASDPILLKSFLIFLQDEPTVKAPVTLIDIEEIVRQIFAEAGDALIVLEKDRMFNLFFIKNGKTAHPHLSDTAWSAADDLTFDEQILLYAFEPSSAPVTAYVYRQVTTAPAADLAQYGREPLLALAQSPGSAVAAAPTPPVAAPLKVAGKSIAVEIVAGPQQGARLTVAVPCRIGRKECDLVINDPLVSRRHAQIVLVDGKYIIEDLGSTNGTLVNGSATKRAVLTAADVVSIGETRLKLLP